MERKHLSSTLALTCVILLALAVSSLPLDVNADPCEEMEKEGMLLYQQFQNGKVCKASGIRKDLTDCSFKVGDTEILLAGAIGKTREERMFGSSGSGFYVLSVDPSVTVSVFADKDFGLMVRIQEKPKATGISCMSNEAYITLDAQILNPEQINEIKYSTLPQPASDKDRMK